MANLKEIRGRIKTVKNTRKITSAMSRIAAARLRRAQLAMESARQYGTRMAGIVGEILNEFEDVESLHSMLAPGKGDAVAIVVITADRGLCGGFNSTVNRSAERQIKALREQGREAHVVTIGRKGRDYLRYAAKITPLSHHVAPAKPDEVVDVARDVSAELIALFEGRFELEGDTPTGPAISEVRVVYNYFKNVITQEVRDEQLLPVAVPEPDPSKDGAKDQPKGDAPGESRDAVRHAVRAFEPDTRELLAHLLPVALETAVQQALYNSVAAEVAARRAAMDSATDNASELIDELTLQYNRERQAAITKELMEIIGGAEALKG